MHLKHPLGHNIKNVSLPFSGSTSHRDILLPPLTLAAKATPINSILLFLPKKTNEHIIARNS